LFLKGDSENHVCSIAAIVEVEVEVSGGGDNESNSSESVGVVGVVGAL